MKKYSAVTVNALSLIRPSSQRARKWTSSAVGYHPDSG